MTPGRIAYVVQQYPALRTTFIRREVDALRGLGLDICVISMRLADRASLGGDPEALSHIDTTMYLPASPISPRMLWANLIWAIRRPIVTLRNLRLVISNPGQHGRWRRLRLLLQVWRGAVLASMGRASNCTRLHAHFADGAATTALAASRLLGVPFSFTSHSSYDSPALREKLAEAAFIASIGEFDRAQLISAGAPADRVHVIRCGLPLEQWRFELRTELRSPLRIVSVGALIEKKGHDILIRACRRLIESGTAIECRIVGAGPMHRQLGLLIDQLNLTQSVRLLGPLSQNETREQLRRADVFVLACKRTPAGDVDGIPVSVMEAMASGLPVVSTRISGIPELIEHGVSGLLAEPGSDESLSVAIEKLISGQHDSAAPAHAARRRIESEFDSALQASRLAALFAMPDRAEASAPSVAVSGDVRKAICRQDC